MNPTTNILNSGNCEPLFHSRKMYQYFEPRIQILCILRFWILRLLYPISRITLPSGLLSISLENPVSSIHRMIRPHIGSRYLHQARFICLTYLRSIDKRTNFSKFNSRSVPATESGKPRFQKICVVHFFRERPLPLIS